MIHRQCDTSRRLCYGVKYTQRVIIVHRHCPEEMTEKGSKLPQFLAAAAASLSAIAAGAAAGWTSPILPQLEKDGGPLGSPISKEQSSWIGSLMPLGALIGSLAAGYLGERWSPKRTLLFSTVPCLIGWILVATAGHIAQLYVARIMTGFAVAMIFTSLPMYCGEIAETSVRGALGSFLQLFVTIGFLYICAIGPFVSYMVLWILSAILPVIFFVCFVMMPESPYFLLKQGHRDKAIASLARLRSKSEAAVQKEADEIQVTLDEAFKNQVSFSDLFKVKANFKALTYTCGLVTFQQLSGITVVLTYLHNIFIAAGGLVPSETAPIVIAVVQMLASAVTPVVVDTSGRKILLVFSSVGETLSLSALGLYFYLKEVQHADDVVKQISWLPLVAVIIFIATYCVGWGSVTWAMMGEMFASNVKAKASSITVFICWSISFILTKFSSNLEEAFNGKFVTFWLFGGFCILSIFFTVLLLPETKGKTFQQIQDELGGVTSIMNVENGTNRKG
ncbi:PREDICTED: facilitated trehalose transporter Tret1-2 homolog [Vollenhovia emeryi]|uniref:facilitated trehalose transporter Tret1-2 homolog n=1 Tax=Vollenhovia emeryi TaxID=411798 RepID=UPI0005F5139E|nr:PREDICTED: facilitated trehalose transporter Tret1-2 homolog [Vollenhovia emeryi]